MTTESSNSISLLLREPPSANRWWRNVGGRMVTSKAARDYKQYVSAECLQHGLYQPIPAPQSVAVVVEWFRSRKSGDLDKRLGVLFDALQGNAYDNDNQVVRIVAERRDHPTIRGRVEVTVVAMGNRQ